MSIWKRGTMIKISKGDSLDRIYLLKLFGYGLFLHKIHTSDPPNIFHSHPWNGYSIIFGTYTEEFADTPGVKYCRRFTNKIQAKRHHRVEVAKPVWTLFFHLKKSNKWGILTLDGKEVEAPWDGEKGHKSYSGSLENS